jgi:hypothetical protein
MARPRGGPHNERDSIVLGVRVPNELAEKIYTAAGAREGSQLAEWMRRALQAALGKAAGSSPAIVQGYEEGKRQGWSHANKLFREALGVAAAKLKKG